MADNPSFADMMGGESYWQEPDSILTSLVSLMANRLGLELGVTLLVKGNIITGTIVGEREYLNAVNDLFKTFMRESIEKPSKEQLRTIEENVLFNLLTEDFYADEYEDDKAAEEAFEEFDITMIRYLHLKNPLIVFSNGSLSLSDSPVPILRIRLTTIDGWLIGRMTVTDEEDEVDYFPPDNGLRH